MTLVSVIYVKCLCALSHVVSDYEWLWYLLYMLNVCVRYHTWSVIMNDFGVCYVKCLCVLSTTLHTSIFVRNLVRAMGPNVS